MLAHYPNLQDHFTSSIHHAARQSIVLNSQLEDQWNLPRKRDMHHSLWRHFNAQPLPFSDATQRLENATTATIAPRLSGAAETNTSLKGAGRSKTFAAGVHRSLRYLVEIAGNKSINAYVRAKANAWRSRSVGLYATSGVRFAFFGGGLIVPRAPPKRAFSRSLVRAPWYAPSARNRMTGASTGSRSCGRAVESPKVSVVKSAQMISPDNTSRPRCKLRHFLRLAFVLCLFWYHSISPKVLRPVLSTTR